MYKFLASVFLCFIFSSEAEENTEYDLSDLVKGQHKVITWKGYPVYVFNLSHEQRKLLRENKYEISSEKYNKTFTKFAKTYGNNLASLLFASSISRTDLDKKYHVVLGLSSVNGCMVKLKNNVLYDQCSGQEFSLDGRMMVTNHESQELSLLVPTHKIEGITLIIKSALTKSELIDFSPEILTSNLTLKEKYFDSIHWDKLDNVKSLLQRKPELINAKTQTKCGSVHLAAIRSHKTLKYLLGLGHSPNIICQGGETPLQFAVMLKNSESAKLLIENGAYYEKFCIEGLCSKSLYEFMLDQNFTNDFIENYMVTIGASEI